MRLNHSTHTRRCGFTLIELLVVVLILAILMAVALPLYLSAVADSQKKTCRNNLQTIANTVQAGKVKGQLPDYTSFYTTNVAANLSKFPDLVNAPLCPSGGTYSVAAGSVTGSFSVACSIPDHGSYEPGVNSN